MTNGSCNPMKIPVPILLSAKFLELVSTRLATSFAARLFTTPIRHKIPKRELHMLEGSRQKEVFIPAIGKTVIAYFYGTSDRKILLVHGWSGRGTQLVKIADALLIHGFSTISFDAPAHGKSKGSTTLMPEFIASVMELEKQFGPFEFAIGHSLGGMSILNAVKDGLKVDKVVSIGAADIIQDIIDDFVRRLKLKSSFGLRLRDHFEKKHGMEMDSFSASRAAKQVGIPVLIVHDEDDEDVPLTAARHIHECLENADLIITKGLGHRKILGNEKVIKKILNFIGRA